MKKLILTGLLTLLTAQGFAKGGSDIGSGTIERLSCPVGALKATTNATDLDSSLAGEIKLVDVTTEENGEGRVEFKSATGQVVELTLAAVSYPENNMAEILMFTSVDQKIDSFGSILLKQNKTKNEYLLLKANSMEEQFVNVKLIGSALKKLKKYGVTNYDLSNDNLANFYEKIVSKAISNGDLKKGEIIATIIPKGCNIK